MSDQPLFKDSDEQEQAYAPEQIPGNDQVIADQTGGIVRKQPHGLQRDADAPVPVGAGTNIAAAPASENFDPGMEREERDLERGDTSVVGRDPRDNPKP